MTFPVTVATYHLCTRVRRGIFLLDLVLAPALALLPFAFARRLALKDSADVHRYQTCQCVCSYKGIRRKASSKHEQVASEAFVLDALLTTAIFTRSDRITPQVRSYLLNIELIERTPHITFTGLRKNLCCRLILCHEPSPAQRPITIACVFQQALRWTLQHNTNMKYSCVETRWSLGGKAEFVIAPSSLSIIACLSLE